ncbi:hypothetical protein LTR08_002322 [Meristemomyces frigidus]|nr:hypothetical protein LTR08_002322 [Meristemomyces frigidus]
MRAHFGRWLARPSTLPPLRRLVDPSVRPQSSRVASDGYARRKELAASKRANQRLGVTASAASTHVGTVRRLDYTREKHAGAVCRLDYTREEHAEPVRRLDYTPEEALRLSAKELGLHMSFRAGVSLLEMQLSKKYMSGLGGGVSFDTLRYQADVSAKDELGARLVDQAEHRQNLRLWIELLQFRQRLDGLVGIAAVWHGMRQREVELPVDGEEADIMWPTFVHAIIDERKWMNIDLLDYIVDLKQRTGQHYAKLYELIVGSYLRVLPSLARFWHERLSDAGIVSPDAPRNLILDAIHSPWPSHAFKEFRRLYRSCQARDLYDACITEALKLESSPATALPWHRFLIKSGDAPSPAMFARPDVQRLFVLDGDKSLPMVHQKENKEPKSHGIALPEYPPVTRVTMSSLVGEVHGIKPKDIGDTFVAKMFATRAFSLDLVLRGLSFFAVDSLGPVALREMAIRAGSPVEFCNHLPTLKAMNIGIANDAYCGLLQKVAREGQPDLFQALIFSDQHPEAYSDTQTQELLLTSSLEESNWIQAHLTLLCLSQAGAAQHAGAWNRVVQHYCRKRQHSAVAQTIQHVQTEKLPLTFETLRLLHCYILPLRKRGKRPGESERRDRPPFNALDFVTNAVMYASETARRTCTPENHVGARVWMELLKRYGMTHRFPELAKLVLWLVARHSNAGETWLHPSNQLHWIFSRQTQEALFAWGFRNAGLRHQLRPMEERPGHRPLPEGHAALTTQPTLNASAEVWAQGLPLLLLLRSRGVRVEDESVKTAFRTRMWILFGPGDSTVAMNETIRRENRLSLAHFIRGFNDFWRDNPFDIDEQLLDKPELAPALLLAFFGPAMRVGLAKEEPRYGFVHVERWAQAVASGGWREEMRGKTSTERRRIWKWNAFRYGVARESYMQKEGSWQSILALVGRRGERRRERQRRRKDLRQQHGLLGRSRKSGRDGSLYQVLETTVQRS